MTKMYLVDSQRKSLLTETLKPVLRNRIFDCDQQDIANDLGSLQSKARNPRAQPPSVNEKRQRQKYDKDERKGGLLGVSNGAYLEDFL